MEHCLQAISSADIPVGFAGAEFLIGFMLPFAPIKAHVAACLHRGRQVRAPAASLYCSAFFATFACPRACLPCLPHFRHRQATHRQAYLAGNQLSPEHQDRSGAGKTGVRIE